MAVITISREVGSGGDAVARRVCELLGYSYFDKTMMIRVAHEMGLSEGEVVDFSEDSYRMRGFIDAVLRRSAPVATGSVWTATAGGGETRVASIIDEDAATRFVASTICALADQGNVVVVGRGGQAVLGGRPQAVHVRIIAGREHRIPKLMEEANLTRAAANRQMDERDRAAAQYLKRFYHIDWADPLLYHLTINLSFVTEETAAQLIVAAAQGLELQAAQPTAAAAS